MNARWFRRLVNVYPPYLGAGVHLDEMSDDFRYARVSMPLRFYNRNYVGTHFGGSLFSMTDPFLMIMLIRNLGPDFVVWDRSANIEYVAPGRGRVTTEFRIGDADLDAIRAHTATGEKHFPEFDVEVRGPDGEVVARVRKQLYVRARPRGPRETSAAGR